MEKVLSAIFVLALAVCAAAQSVVERVVDAEHAFAQMAVDKGTKAAFLANMTNDAVVFTPDRTNAKAHWSARPDTTPGAPLLLWAPNYAGASADGRLGYTTGNWEFRPKGKEDQPTGFGEFITVWVRQAEGQYKWIIDMGLSHPAPGKYSVDWVTSKAAFRNDVKLASPNAIDVFIDMGRRGDLAKAYKKYAAPDIRLYREDKLPFIGRTAALRVVDGEKGQIVTEKGMFTESSDLAYVNAPYQRMVDGKETEKGNYLQIWKFVGGKWQIVLDFFKPVLGKK